MPALNKGLNLMLRRISESAHLYVRSAAVDLMNADSSGLTCFASLRFSYVDVTSGKRR